MKFRTSTRDLTLLSNAFAASLVVAMGAGCSDPEGLSEAGVDNLTGSGAVSDWVKAAAKDLPSLDLAPGDKAFAATLYGAIDPDVEVVGVGENSHGAHEYNQLRSKVFQYLAENHGFRAIVPETGIVEAALVDKYVQGTPGVTLEEVLKRGFTHHMGLAEEARQLVEWMRKYNEGKSSDQRVHFGGKDLSLLGDTLTVPLEPLLAYLEKVDPTYASSAEVSATMELVKKASAVTLQVDAAFHAQGANEIDPDLLDPFTTISFEQLSTEEQSKLEKGVAEIAQHVKAASAEYSAASTPDDYEWNAQLAVIATQITADLRARQAHPKIFAYDQAVKMLAAAAPQVVVDRRPASDPKSHVVDSKNAADLRDYFLGREAREKALAANVGWVQKRYGKIMNFAHYGHLNKLPLESVSAGGLEVRDTGNNEGAFIAKEYGKRYTLFGTTTMDFKDAKGKLLTTFQGAPVINVADKPESFEHDVVDIARPRRIGLFVDLKHGKNMPDGLGKRLYRFNNSFQRLDLRANYDGIFVFSSVGPELKLGETR